MDNFGAEDGATKVESDLLEKEMDRCHLCKGIFHDVELLHRGLRFPLCGPCAENFEEMQAASDDSLSVDEDDYDGVDGPEDVAPGGTAPFPQLLEEESQLLDALRFRCDFIHERMLWSDVAGNLAEETRLFLGKYVEQKVPDCSALASWLQDLDAAMETLVRELDPLEQVREERQTLLEFFEGCDETLAVIQAKYNLQEKCMISSKEEQAKPILSWLLEATENASLGNWPSLEILEDRLRGLSGENEEEVNEIVEKNVWNCMD
jgi:hypothetical protein